MLVPYFRTVKKIFITPEPKPARAPNASCPKPICESLSRRLLESLLESTL